MHDVCTSKPMINRVCLKPPLLSETDENRNATVNSLEWHLKQLSNFFVISSASLHGVYLQNPPSTKALQQLPASSNLSKFWSVVIQHETNYFVQIFAWLEVRQLRRVGREGGSSLGRGRRGGGVKGRRGRKGEGNSLQLLGQGKEQGKPICKIVAGI